MLELELNREYLVWKYGRDYLTEVQWIILASGEITTIEENRFKGLLKLEILDLVNNKLTELNERFTCFLRFSRSTTFEAIFKLFN